MSTRTDREYFDTEPERVDEMEYDARRRAARTNVGLSVEARKDALLACETPDEVFDMLREHGIKGWKNARASCPIAEFYKAAKDCDGAIVTGESAHIYFRGVTERSAPIDIHSHNQATRSFIRHFDDTVVYNDLANLYDFGAKRPVHEERN